MSTRPGPDDHAGAAHAIGWALREATSTPDWAALHGLVFAPATPRPSLAAFRTWFAVTAAPQRIGRFSAPSEHVLLKTVLAFTARTLDEHEAARLELAWGGRRSESTVGRTDATAESNRSVAADARHWGGREAGVSSRSARQLTQAVTGEWPPPRVADLDLVTGFRFTSDFSGDEPTEYVRRASDGSLDERVRDALDTYRVDPTSGLLPKQGSDGARSQARGDWRRRVIVVAGPPKSGKTRSVIEALHRHGLGQSRVLLVRPPTGHGPGPATQPLSAIAEARFAGVGGLDLEARPLVVLADDLQVHLRRGLHWTAASRGLVDRSGCVLLIAIVHDDVLHLSPEAAVSLGLVEPELQALSTMAVRYAAALDPDEEEAAARTFAPGIESGAVLREELGHLAEYFASVPALTRRAESALRGGPTAMSCVMRAALDCTILRPEGFTQAMLRHTAGVWWRSQAPTRGRLSDVDFSAGIEWITTALGSRYALINPTQHDLELWTVMDAVASRLLGDHVPLPGHAGRVPADQEFRIGSHYQHRLGLLQPAVGWYERAAAGGIAGAMNNLGWIAERDGDLTAALEWYTRGAEAGDENAMRNLGVHAEAMGDAIAARAWYERAAEAGQRAAMLDLATLDEKAGDLDRARQWLAKAAEAGDARASHRLGDMLSHTDIAAARRWWMRAAEGGHAASMKHLGDTAPDGDVDEARAWFRRAARFDEAAGTYAMRRLGGLARDGGDAEEAAHWYERAAARGDVVAMREFGTMWFGAGDVARARQRWLDAAGLGDRIAMKNLAALAEQRGDDEDVRQWLERSLEGTEHPDVAALWRLAQLAHAAGQRGQVRRWLELVADAGDADAMRQLGDAFDDDDDRASALRWWTRAADAGQGRAMWQLAAVANDDGDPARARSWLERAAEAYEDPPSYLLRQLGDLLDRLGEPDQARPRYERAASGGDGEAMWVLGNLAYLAGDLAGAREWWARSAESGYFMGMRNLGELVARTGDDETARVWLAAAAELGDATAMNDLGVLDRGAGDIDRAEGWFLRAAELDDPDAMLNLLRLLENGGDLVTAEEWFERASHVPDLSAELQHLMGDFRGRRNDRDGARAWWGQAAKGGNAPAMRHLGEHAVAAGRLAEAHDWLRQAASGGDTLAMTDLGRLALDADDPDEARSWYERAADGGYGPAMRSLAILAENAGDRELARHWAERGAAAGDAGAMLRARGLAAGRGDTDAARSWLERAAEAGDAPAMNELAGYLYAEEDAAGAEAWFRRSAATGDLTGARGVGILLEEAGEDDRAREWFLTAAEGGDDVAMVLLGMLEMRAANVVQAGHWLEQAGSCLSGLALYLLGSIAEEQGDARSASYYESARAAGFDEQAYLDTLDQLG